MFEHPFDKVYSPVQIVYYDGQFDDARLNVALACTAVAAGAAVLNHTKVTKLLKVHLLRIQSPSF